MGAMQRLKGKIGEREWVNFLKTKYLIHAERSQQHKGNVDSADVISDWDHIHWEVKRCQVLNVQNAMKKLRTECGDKKPVIAHRRNNEPWMLTMDAEDFLEIIYGI